MCVHHANNYIKTKQETFSNCVSISASSLTHGRDPGPKSASSAEQLVQGRLDIVVVLAQQLEVYRAVREAHSLEVSNGIPHLLAQRRLLLLLCRRSHGILRRKHRLLLLEQLARRRRVLLRLLRLGRLLLRHHGLEITLVLAAQGVVQLVLTTHKLARDLSDSLELARL